MEILQWFQKQTSRILHTISAVRSYMDRSRLTCRFKHQLAANGLNWLIIYIGKIERDFEPVIIA